MKKSLKTLYSMFSAFGIVVVILISFVMMQFSTNRELNSLDNTLEEITENFLKQILIEGSEDLISQEETVQQLVILLDTPLFKLNNLSVSGFNSRESGAAILNAADIQDLFIQIELINHHLSEYQNSHVRSQEILFILFVAVTIILIIFLGFLELDHYRRNLAALNKKEMNRKLIDLLEYERNLLAGELHDDLAQKLSIVRQHFDSPEAESDHSEILKRYTSDVITGIRSIAQGLRSPHEDELSFRQQLEFLFADFSSISDIKLNTRFLGLQTLILKSSQQLHVYRILQELLTNCRKHSGASIADIQISAVHPYLKISYSDNGNGIVESHPRGMGLKNMEYRLKIINAETTIRNPDQGGLVMNFVIPVNQ